MDIQFRDLLESQQEYSRTGSVSFPGIASGSLFRKASRGLSYSHDEDDEVREVLVVVDAELEVPLEVEDDEAEAGVDVDVVI